MALLNIEKFSTRPAIGILCAIAFDPRLAAVMGRDRAAHIAILCRGGGVVLEAGALVFPTITPVQGRNAGKRC